jgi:GNAT superfamily N-acetyltransferase
VIADSVEVEVEAEVETDIPIDTRAGSEIKPVSVLDIFNDANYPTLLQAYAEECTEPDSNPQQTVYVAMEQTGVLRCFAAYSNDTLIGFVSVLVSAMPHNGQRMAVVESLFVAPDYRSTGAGEKLIAAVEEFTAESGCARLTFLPRTGSKLDKVLSRRAGYSLTHLQYTRRFV